MKCLILLAHRVRSLLLSNRLISVLYFGGALLAVFSMLFMYMTQLSQIRYNEEGYYEYSIRSEGDESFSVDMGLDAICKGATLMEDRQDMLWGGFYAQCRLKDVFGELLGNSDLDTIVFPMVLYEGKYTGQVEWRMGLDLCAECDDVQAYPVLLERNMLGMIGVNDPTNTADKTINLFGETHTLLGVHGEFSDYIMFEPDDPCVSLLSFKVLRFVTRRPLSGSELSGLKDLAEALFDKPVLHTPSTPETKYREAFLSEMLLIEAFTAVSMIGFAFLFSFLLESRADEIRVMLLCGASKLRVSLMVLADAVVVNLIMGVVSLFIFHFTKEAIFSSFVNTNLRLSDYLIVLLCFLAASVLVSCPILYSYATNTIAEMRQKYLK